jgi:hypothetical protein
LYKGLFGDIVTNKLIFFIIEETMDVKIEEAENGDIFFRIPIEFEEVLQWEEGDVIEWIDNKDGSWTLQRRRQKHRYATCPEVCNKA